MSPYRCHVISNTHWDREWRYSFQAYRMDLVDLMDRLLDLLETRPEYRAFFLDSQTVILEDYLEIRPENEERVRRMVAADRLQIGPWFTLPDAWGCPGEALVRNLLMGHRVARRFGPVAKVGYTPFSNGQISQLPQIYRGFGIDSCFFYRGIGKHVAKSEFIWESPDGTPVFGFRFGDYARYNYYYLLYRPGLLGRTLKMRTYDWTPEEMPCRVATEQAYDRQYGWGAQRLRVHEELLDASLDEAIQNTAPDATTSQLLYMMGHDHSFAAEGEIDLIQALQRRLAGQNREEIVHSTLAEYMEAFRREAHDLQVLRGEMRHTNKEGLWTNLMAMILSCRLYLKQRNARLNARILHEAEPLAAMAWLTGSPYPAPFFDVAWKKILVNQAHDAIGGCSMDRVHEEMLGRWNEVETLADEISRRSMRDVARRIGAAVIPDDCLQLTVFNTLGHERTGVVDAILDVPSAFPPGPLRVETPEGQPVAIQCAPAEDYTATIEGGYELSMEFGVRRTRARLYLENLPAFGYSTYVMRPGVAAEAQGQRVGGEADKLDGSGADYEIENEFYTLRANTNGTFRLTDRRTGRVFDGLGALENTAEFGDPWNRKTPPGDRAILSTRAASRRHTRPAQVIESGPLASTLRIAYSLRIPAAKDPAADARSAETAELPIALEATLKKGSRVAEITLRLENRARDHRLRILFPSGVRKAQSSWAEGQFDVLERPIRIPPAEGWKEPPYPTHPMWNFVDVSDGREGFAVLNDGLTEYEAVDDARRTVAITLLRAFGKFVFGRPTPGSQCLGPHVYRFGIVPHAGLWSDAALPRLTAEFITAPVALESAPTRGQETQIVKGVSLPLRHSFLGFEPSGAALVVSALKQSEDGRDLVLRVWNPLDRPVETALRTGFPVREAERLTLEELPLAPLAVEMPSGGTASGGGASGEAAARVPLVIEPKKIATLRLRL